jgi:hypothetical protein
MEGTANDACGTGGATCATCGSSDTCVSKACVATCDGGACETWTAQTNPTGSSDEELNNFVAIWGSGPNDIYLVADSGDLFHSTGDGTWTLETTATGGALHCGAVWGSGPTDVYAGFDEGVLLHSTGDGHWSPETVPTSNGITGLWGSSAGDVYMAAANVLHSTGNQTWTIQDPSTAEYSYLWGSGPNDVYASGPSGFLAQSMGNGTWTFPNSIQGIVSSIWGSSATDIYAVGSDDNTGKGAIFHGDGTGYWDEQLTGSFSATAVWGSSSGDVYVVGGTKIQHSTGNGTWTSHTISVSGTLNAVWGSSSSDVYAVGGYGIILHGP